MNQHASTITEVINRNVVVTLLLKQGYNVFLPVYDDGIDFIVHRRSDDCILKVQLKSRWIWWSMTDRTTSPSMTSPHGIRSASTTRLI
jgi:hypothetical protein